jgi:hypothetical protein
VRALHTIGNEEGWWVEKGIDAKAEALRLWRQSHGIPAPTDVEEATGTAAAVETQLEAGGAQTHTAPALSDAGAE